MGKDGGEKKKTGKYILVIKIVGLYVGIASLMGILLSFTSGLKMNDDYNAAAKYTPQFTDEEVLINQLLTGGFDDEDLGEFMFSEADLMTILTEVNKTKKAHATDYDYQYYWETWCVVSYQVLETVQQNIQPDGTILEGGTQTIAVTVETPSDSEYSEEDVMSRAGENFVPGSCVWGWHHGYRYLSEKNEPLVEINNENYERNSKYAVDWQSIYAMALMASQEHESYWWEDYSKTDPGEIINERIDEEVLEKIIDAFRYDFTYAFDGASEKNMKTIGEWVYLDETYVDENGEIKQDVKDMLKEGFEIRRNPGNNRWKIKMVTGYEKATKKVSWSELEKLTYTVESEGNWALQENGKTVYKRTLRKIPATSLLTVNNAYMSMSMHASENTVTCEGINKYKYYEKGLTGNVTNTDMNCAYQHNKQFDGGIYAADPQQFYVTASMLIEDFDWSRFIMYLETLPNSDEIVQKYEEMYEAWKAGTSIYRDLEEDEYKEVIFGSGRGDKFGDNGYYYIPDLQTYEDDTEASRSLLVSDNLDAEAVHKLLEYHGFAGKTDSVFNLDTNDITEWLLKLQDDYGVSIIGMLAIAAQESGWGTNRKSQIGWNVISWGCYDRDDGTSEDGRNFKAESGSIGEAVYKNFEVIYKNYLAKGQDSYTLMCSEEFAGHRFNTYGTWEFKCASIRRQLESYLGIESTVKTLVGVPGTICADFICPCGYSYRVTSKFGYREAFNTSDGTMSSSVHMGVDLARGQDILSAGGNIVGAPVVAAYEGTVSEVRKGNGSWSVRINHTNGVATRYVHVYECCVQPGDVVQTGQIISYVAPTDGDSTAPHLHFEMKINGTLVDPQDYMAL